MVKGKRTVDIIQRVPERLGEGEVVKRLPRLH